MKTTAACTVRHRPGSTAQRTCPVHRTPSWDVPKDAEISLPIPAHDRVTVLDSLDLIPPEQWASAVRGILRVSDVGLRVVFAKVVDASRALGIAVPDEVQRQVMETESRFGVAYIGYVLRRANSSTLGGFEVPLSAEFLDRAASSNPHLVVERSDITTARVDIAITAAQSQPGFEDGFAERFIECPAAGTEQLARLWVGLSARSRQSYRIRERFLSRDEDCPEVALREMAEGIPSAVAPRARQMLDRLRLRALGVDLENTEAVEQITSMPGWGSLDADDPVVALILSLHPNP